MLFGFWIVFCLAFCLVFCFASYIPVRFKLG